MIQGIWTTISFRPSTKCVFCPHPTQSRATEPSSLALLLEQNDERQLQRRYLSLERLDVVSDNSISGFSGDYRLRPTRVERYSYTLRGTRSLNAALVKLDRPIILLYVTSHILDRRRVTFDFHTSARAS